MPRDDPVILTAAAHPLTLRTMVAIGDAVRALLHNDLSARRRS